MSELLFWVTPEAIPAILAVATLGLPIWFSLYATNQLDTKMSQNDNIVPYVNGLDWLTTSGIYFYVFATLGFFIVPWLLLLTSHPIAKVIVFLFALAPISIAAWRYFSFEKEVQISDSGFSRENYDSAKKCLMWSFILTCVFSAIVMLVTIVYKKPQCKQLLDGTEIITDEATIESVRDRLRRNGQHEDAKKMCTHLEAMEIKSRQAPRSVEPLIPSDMQFGKKFYQ